MHHIEYPRKLGSIEKLGQTLTGFFLKQRYKVEVALFSASGQLGAYETHVVDLTSFTYTVTGLLTFRKYSFRVSVRNNNVLGYVNMAIGRFIFLSLCVSLSAGAGSYGLAVALCDNLVCLHAE